jgi:hypothetical protein
MNHTVELNPGEIKVKLNAPLVGKTTFTELGLKDEDLVLENGLLRMVFDLEHVGEHNYFHTPTIEVAYQEEVGATHWQCDFNKTTILDKIDNHGRSTVILLNRKSMSDMEQRHKNRLVVHAEFPEKVHLIADESYINMFK